VTSLPVAPRIFHNFSSGNAGLSRSAEVFPRAGTDRVEVSREPVPRQRCGQLAEFAPHAGKVVTLHVPGRAEPPQ